MNKIIKILLILFFIITLNNIYSVTEHPKTNDVYVGIYLNEIFDLSLKDNKFSADFYVWFRWKGENINPIETFEVVNGRIDAKENSMSDVVKEYNYAICRVTATMTKFWDIKRFPLDNHVLTIEIEDSENEDFKLKYIADAENSNMNKKIEVPGWSVLKFNSEIITNKYNTNYGDISLPSNDESSYSRFVFSLDIIRPGFGYFLKSFFTVFIAAVIALLTLFIKPTDLDPRFGLSAGALFAAVASEVVIASSLPDTNIITLVDKLHIISIFFIFIAIAESIISLKIFSSGKESGSKALDLSCFYLSIIAYILLIMMAIIF